MSDINNHLASYERYKEALAKANEHNKTVVFDALAEAGITSVTAEFDGEGDQGQIDAVTPCAGETHVDMPPSSVAIHLACWQEDTITLTNSTQPLSEAIETLCYEYLEQTHGGWENNDGAFGTFEFDVARRTVQLEFNGRYTDINTSNYEF